MKRFIIDIEGDIDLVDLTRIFKNSKRLKNLKIIEAKVEVLHPDRPIGWDR